jgi:hypothetical protein
MATFEKDVLYPGEWYLPNGRVFRCTPGDVRHLGQRMQEMLLAGVPIPLAWEHQAEAVADTPERWEALKAATCKAALGGADQAALAPEGFLKSVVTVPGDADAERLKAIRFVSPEIRKDFKDGRGRVWPGLSIVGLAATQRPVQYPQKPFKPVALSQAGSHIILSLAGYRLAYDDGDDDGGRPGAGDLGKPDLSATADNDAENKKVRIPAAGNLDGLLKALADPCIGLVLPGDTTADNLVERLMTAALTKKSAAESSKEEEPYPGTQPPQPEAPPPMTMSLEDRVKATETRLLSLEKAGLKKRAEALFTSGRVSKPTRDKLLAELDKAPLRLSQAGELEPCPVAHWIEALELNDAGSAWPAADRERLSQGGDPLTPVPQPEGIWGAPQTDAEADKAADAFFKLVPGGARD